MTRKLIDLFPRDPRITAAYEAEQAAREARKQVIQEIQAACAHADIGEAWAQGEGTSRVCFRCGYFEVAATRLSERRLDHTPSFEIQSDEFYDRRLFTDR